MSGQSPPLNVDPNSLAGLGITNIPTNVGESSAARRASTPRRGPTPIPPSTSSSAKSRASPPYAKKKGKDEKGGKDMRKSCAECRRLKAKCDRVFPCSNCRRRGCALVCPDGDLSCMQGKRLVLASTEHLHNWISELEAALSQAHAKVSKSPHPLLQREYLDGGFATQPGTGGSGSQSRAGTVDSVAQASAGLEGLALADEVVNATDTDFLSGQSQHTAYLRPDFRPDTAPRAALTARLKRILGILPPREEAAKMADHFFHVSEWFNHVLRPDEYNRIYEPSVYAPTEQNPLSLHKLAGVLMVMCLQLWLDPTRQLDRIDGRVAIFWDAAQECFDSRCGWTPSIPGVQALGLMCWFVNLSCKGVGSSNFYWLRQLTIASLQLGLHKEPHPSLPQTEQNFRRRIFWETTVLDCVLAPYHGLHMGIPMEHVEVRYPSDAPQWHVIRYEFMRTVNYPAIDLALRPDTNPPSIPEIRGLEELLAHYVPEAQPTLHCPYLVGEPLPEPRMDGPVDITDIERCSTSMVLFMSYLGVYRSCLRRLVARLRANPDAEFSSWDSHVAVRTFETAQTLIRCARYYAHSQPQIVARNWTNWSQLFGACVAMTATIIWCGPQLGASYIGQAIVELDDISRFSSEAIGFTGSDRPAAVRELIPTLKSMIVGRYPHVVGDDPTHVVANLRREDMLYALLGGTVETAGQQASWTAAIAAATGQAQPTTWAPVMTPGMFDSPRAISPALIHTPQQEGVPTVPGSFQLGNPAAGSYFPSVDPQMGIDPRHISPPRSHTVPQTAYNVSQIGSQSIFADAPMMDSLTPNLPSGGSMPGQQLSSSELWNRLQAVYVPTSNWGLDDTGAMTGTPVQAGQQYRSSFSATSAPASLSASMPNRTASLSPVPPFVPRVMNVMSSGASDTAAFQQAQGGQTVQGDQLRYDSMPPPSMPPPPIFQIHPQSQQQH